MQISEELMKKAEAASRGLVPEAVLREILSKIPSEEVMQLILPHTPDLMKTVPAGASAEAAASQIMKALSKMGEGKGAGKPSDSVSATRRYFDKIWLEQRMLDPVEPDTTLHLFGESFRSPIMTAALSHIRGGHQGSEEPILAYAKGAVLSGCVHWVGMSTNEEYCKIAATGARIVRIIKPYADENEIFSQIRCAEETGALAVGMDIDHWYTTSGQIDTVFGHKMAPKSREQLRSYIDASNLPFVFKGVLSVRDAMKAAEIGASAIVVSHHNGRMNYAMPPLALLPDIVSKVGNTLKIFVDCGIASGADAYKALALGANAVCVGSHLIPYTKKGAEAVCERLEDMTGDLNGFMAFTGVKDLNSFDSSVLHYLM